MSSEQQVQIPSADVALTGVLYTPASTSGNSVLFCDPLFEERKGAHRVLVDTARALADAGVAVLRFDYRGCGDSPGEFNEFSVDDWRTDITAAMDFLNDRTPAPRTGILTVRLGASLVLPYAFNAAPVDFMVLWEPILDAGTYLDEAFRAKLMKEMLTFGRGHTDRETLRATLKGGSSIDLDGYELTSSLYGDLVDINSLMPTTSKGIPVFLAQIGHREQLSQKTEETVTLLRNAGLKVTSTATREQPFWSMVGLSYCPALIKQTVNWIVGPTTARQATEL